MDDSLVFPTIGYYELYHGTVKEGRDPVLVHDDLPGSNESTTSGNTHWKLPGYRSWMRRAAIQHPDMMLAGVARSLGVPVVTADGGFDRIEHIEVENHRKMY